MAQLAEDGSTTPLGTPTSQQTRAPSKSLQQHQQALLMQQQQCLERKLQTLYLKQNLQEEQRFAARGCVLLRQDGHAVREAPQEHRIPDTYSTEMAAALQGGTTPVGDDQRWTEGPAPRGAARPAPAAHPGHQGRLPSPQTQHVSLQVHSGFAPSPRSYAAPITPRGSGGQCTPQRPTLEDAAPQSCDTYASFSGLGMHGGFAPSQSPRRFAPSPRQSPRSDQWEQRSAPTAVDTPPKLDAPSATNRGIELTLWPSTTNRSQEFKFTFTIYPIGLKITTGKMPCAVSEVEAGGTAEILGVQSGMVIKAIDGEDVTCMAFEPFIRSFEAKLEHLHKFHPIVEKDEERPGLPPRSASRSWMQLPAFKILNGIVKFA